MMAIGPLDHDRQDKLGVLVQLVRVAGFVGRCFGRARALLLRRFATVLTPLRRVIFYFGFTGVAARVETVRNDDAIHSRSHNQSASCGHKLIVCAGSVVTKVSRVTKGGTGFGSHRRGHLAAYTFDKEGTSAGFRAKENVPDSG